MTFARSSGFCSGKNRESDATVNRKSVDVALLLLRLLLAVVFVAHGGQKLLGWFGGPGVKGFVESMSSLGMPAVVAYLVIIGEFFGGLGLAVGLLTRLAAAGVFIQMVGAVLMIHWKTGFFMNWESVGGKAEGFEYSLTLAVVSLAVLLAGAGAYSLDAKLKIG